MSKVALFGERKTGEHCLGMSARASIFIYLYTSEKKGATLASYFYILKPQPLS